MTRLQQAFTRAREMGSRALMPYVTAGDPDLQTTDRLVETLARNGADIVELGVPYSDPIADGPTVQRATQRALQQGVRTGAVFELVAGLRRRLETPIALLVYYNCVYRYGETAFTKAAAQAGVDGLIVPDLPPEAAGSLRYAADEVGVDLIPLLAPTSTPERIRMVAQQARGFIYCVSLTGVTGAREQLSPDLANFLGRIRPHSQVPLAVGFGVSTPTQARIVAEHADGVIVGSALIDRIEAAADAEAAVAAAGAFTAELKAALQDVGVPHRAAT